MTVRDDARSILFVGPSDGGAADVAHGAARALSERGWDVRRVDLGNGRSPLREARRAFRRERDEVRARTVVHVEHGSNDLAAFWFALLAGRVRPDLVTVAHDVPLVVHAPGSGVLGRGSRWRDILSYRVVAPRIDRALRRAYARRVAVALVTSERARDAWVTHCPAQTLRLPIACDAPPSPCPPSSGGHVLFAGYVGPSKGLELLLDAWASINPPPPLPLVVACDGPGEFGSAYLQALRERTRHSASPPRWLGSLSADSFARAIADAAIVVVPYRRSNPASVIVLTAMATGRAIIGSDVPAVADFIVHDIEGLVVPVDDVDALARALASLLADPALRDRLGAAAAARSNREHSWAGHCEALEHAYALAAANRSQAGVT